jgi:hypothetical protein
MPNSSKNSKVSKTYVGFLTFGLYIDNIKEMETLTTIEEAAEYYAHNHFNMHETNSYKELKKGFIAGAKWQANKNFSKK